MTTQASDVRYFVYNNWRRNRGRVHRGDCPHCNHGRGKAGATTGLNDEFLGPFDRQDAFATASALNRKEMAACAVCNP